LNASRLMFMVAPPKIKKNRLGVSQALIGTE
jgi:hypothetical protein